MITRTCLSTLAASLMSLLGGMAAAQDADIQSQLEDLQQKYEEALAAGDAEAIGSMFAEDAIYLPFSGGVAEGREGIQSHHEQNPVQSIDVRSDRTEMVGENVVLDIGTWTATLPQEAGGGTIEGEYVLVAEVGENGLLGRSLTSFLTRQPPGAPPEQ